MITPLPLQHPISPITTMCLKYLTTEILTRERSEEEKRRRHLHGDKGAKFSLGKVPRIDYGGVIGTVTTMVTKDLRLIEIYEYDTQVGHR